MGIGVQLAGILIERALHGRVCAVERVAAAA
jgi:hypothetical protein